MVTIAEVYLMIGALPEGEQLLLQSLDVLPSDGTSEAMLVSASARHQLGVLGAMQGDFDRSIRSLRQAIEIRAEILGDDSGETAASRFVLAWPLAENGYAIDDKSSLAEAVRLLEAVLAQRKESLGVAHAETANAQLALAALLYHQNELLKAMALLAQARGVFLELRIENNLAAAIGLLIESEIAGRSGNPAVARRAAEGSLEMVETLLGRQHPLSVLLAWHVARIVNEGDTQGLIKSYRSIVEASRKIPGRPLRNADLFQGLASELRRSMEFEAAETLLQESHQIRLDHLGENHWRVADSFADLGRLERDRGDLKKAETFFRTAFRIYLDNGVIDRRWHGMTCARDLISLLRGQGRHREAGEFERRVAEGSASP